MARAIKISSVSGALTVTITGPNGGTPVVYADSSFVNVQTMPATIADTATTTFWLQGPGKYTLSVKTSGGTEIAADNNSTRPVDVETDGTVAALNYDARTLATVSGDSGHSTAGSAASSASLADKGAWLPSTVYAVGDVVTQDGRRWINKLAETSGTAFSGGTNWTPIDRVDPTSERMRPLWHVAYFVGASRTYTTLDAAITAARTATGGVVAAGAFVPSTTSGNSTFTRGGRPALWRSVIILDAGTYTTADAQGPQLGEGIDIIGSTDNPDDCVIQVTTQQYGIRVWGNFYAANLRVRHNAGSVGNTYVVHHDVSGGNTCYTQIYDNVVFEDNHGALSGIIGSDSPSGVVQVFYKCKMTSISGLGTVNRFVIHTQAPDTLPRTTIFLDCTSTAPFTGCADGADTTGSVDWRIGCTQIDGTVLADQVTIHGVTTATTARPPLPIHGMSLRERDRFFPTVAKISPRTLTPRYPDLVASQTFSAQRVYVIPLDVESSFVVDKFQVYVNSAVGLIAAGMYQPSFGATVPSQWGVFSNGVTAVNGLMSTWTGDAQYTPAFIERGQRIWLGVKLSSATCAVVGSTMMSTVSPCYYFDDAGNNDFPFGTGTLTAVPAGTAVPFVQVLAK